jgi:HPt (histidine-containing phosphotransfer) domain-containing protein
MRAKPINRESLKKILDNYIQRTPLVHTEGVSQKENETSNTLQLGLNTFRKQLGDDFFRELLGSLKELITDSREELSACKNLTEELPKKEGLLALTHKLKGGLQQVGDKYWSNQFFSLEKEIKESELTDTPLAFEKIDRWLKEIDVTISELQDE